MAERVLALGTQLRTRERGRRGGRSLGSGERCGGGGLWMVVSSGWCVVPLGVLCMFCCLLVLLTLAMRESDSLLLVPASASKGKVISAPARLSHPEKATSSGAGPGTRASVFPRLFVSLASQRTWDRHSLCVCTRQLQHSQPSSATSASSSVPSPPPSSCLLTAHSAHLQP